jgi:hypothetical protein
MNKSLIIGVLLIVGLLFLFKRPAPPEVVEIVRVDTLVIVDTVTIRERITKYIERIDTVYVLNSDTITVYRNTFGLQYGTIDVFTHTSGKIHNQYITTALYIPKTTKFITTDRYVVRTYREKPLYLGAGLTANISNHPSLALGVSVVSNNNMFAYHYNTRNEHWITYHRTLDIPNLWRRP